MATNLIESNQLTYQHGEKGHIEYQWSNQMRENMLQFYFQLTRTDNKVTLKNLENRLTHILTSLTQSLQNRYEAHEKDVFIHYLSYLYCLIGQTRDVIE
jgi:hypothetical protein